MSTDSPKGCGCRVYSGDAEGWGLDSSSCRFSALEQENQELRVRLGRLIDALTEIAANDNWTVGGQRWSARRAKAVLNKEKQG